MKKLALATVLASLAVPAFAEPSCDMGDTRAPVWESLKAFEDEGGVVVAFKINSGDCYEIYGTLNGDKYEVFFDPTSGEEIERIED